MKKQLLSLLVLFTLPASAVMIQLKPNTCYSFFTLDITTVPSYIVLANTEPQTYTGYLMTPSQYEDFHDGQYTSVLGVYTITAHGAVAIAINEPGKYYFVIYPKPCEKEINVTMAYKKYGLPVGVVSYPKSKIGTYMIIGFFNITGISAYNPKGESEFQVPNDGAGLQLNAVVEVELENGARQHYWVQNVISFQTSSMRYDVGNNIWNDSSIPSLLSNSTVRGNGAVYVHSEEYYYAFGTWTWTYSVPFAGYLVVRAYASGGAVRVDFGYVIVQNGTYLPAQVVWYDNVTITPSAPAVKAELVSTMSYLTGSGHVLDTELVFCGYANSAYTTFSQLNARLAMAYWGDGAWRPFPNLYSFGLHTAESATNLVSTYSGGFTYVGVGVIRPAELVAVGAVPPLPMTSINYEDPYAGVSYVRYIYSPTTVKANESVIYVGGGTRYVLVGYSVNGEVVGQPPTIYPDGSWFENYEISPIYAVQHLVSVVSPLPVLVNGSEVLNYTQWLDFGSVIHLAARRAVFSNGTMLLPSIANVTLTVTSPIALNISWIPHYLVQVASPIPVEVNGIKSASYSQYIPRGSAVSINVPRRVVLDNGTMFVPNATSATIIVDKPLNVSISWTPYYMVVISSPFQVEVNGTSASTTLEFVRAGSVLVINAPRQVVLDNGTLFVPSINHTVIVVSTPTVVSVEWKPYYQVQISSQRPVLINGTPTTSYFQYLKPGSSLVLRAEPVLELGGLVVLEPNVTETEVVVMKPVNIHVAYSPNYIRLVAAASVAGAAAAAFLIFRRRRAAF